MTRSEMKRRLAAIAGILLATVSVGVGMVYLGIPGAEAQDFAECSAKDSYTAEGDRVSLTICEKGKPIPAEFLDRFSDEAKQWMEKEEAKRSLSPETSTIPSLPGGGRGMSAKTTFTQGADFWCGTGVDCGAWGSLPPWVAIEVDWYRVSGVHIDDAWDACTQEFGCYFETNYYSASSHTGDWVEIYSDYAFAVNGCYCHSGSGTCDVW
jgi:hypothetical protein